jgi:hypothetical protein
MHHLEQRLQIVQRANLGVRNDESQLSDGLLGEWAGRFGAIENLKDGGKNLR